MNSAPKPKQSWRSVHDILAEHSARDTDEWARLTGGMPRNGQWPPTFTRNKPSAR